MKYNALVISGVVADVSEKELGQGVAYQEIILENSEGSYAVLYECGDTPLSKETISGQVVTVPFELIKTEEFGTYKIKALEFLIKAEPSAADRIRAVSSAAASRATPPSVESKTSPQANTGRRPAPSFAKPQGEAKFAKPNAAPGSKVAESIQSRLAQDLSTPVSDDPRVIIKDEDTTSEGSVTSSQVDNFEGDAPNWEEAAEAGHVEDLVVPQVPSNGRPNFSAPKPGFNPPKAGSGRVNTPASFGKKNGSPAATPSVAQKSNSTKTLAATNKPAAPPARGFSAAAKPSKPRPNF